MGASLLWLTPLMAIAYARSDYTAAQMRARSQGHAYAALAGIRQSLTFTVVIGIAAGTRAAGPVVAALAAATLLSVAATILGLDIGGCRTFVAARLRPSPSPAIGRRNV